MPAGRPEPQVRHVHALQNQRLTSRRRDDRTTAVGSTNAGLLGPRWAHASKALEARAGDLSAAEALRPLSALRMEGTLVTASSSVRDLTSREVRLVVARRYGEVHTFGFGPPGR